MQEMVLQGVAVAHMVMKAAKSAAIAAGFSQAGRFWGSACGSGTSISLESYDITTSRHSLWRLTMFRSTLPSHLNRMAAK